MDGKNSCKSSELKRVSRSSAIMLMCRFITISNAGSMHSKMNNNKNRLQADVSVGNLKILLLSFLMAILMTWCLKPVPNNTYEVTLRFLDVRYIKLRLIGSEPYPTQQFKIHMAHYLIIYGAIDCVGGGLLRST